MQQQFAMEESRVSQLPGERFCPMEDELLLFYLKPFLSGQKVPGRNQVVFDCDLYGHQEPWEIWEEYKTRRPNDLRLNKDLYFFTQRKKMSSTDKRIRRTVGSGTWHGNVSGRPVTQFGTGRVVGSKTTFSYKNKTSVQDGCWILYEFDLDRSLRDKKEKVKDYVLCLLRNNSEPKSKIQKKRKQREEEEVLESNDECGDEEHSNTEQEQLLESQAKRQRRQTLPSIDKTPVVPPMPSEEDAFAAELEEIILPCGEDGNSPLSEAEAIGSQGEENEGLLVQSGPSFGDDHQEIYPLPEKDFVMEECLEACPNIEREEQDLGVMNSTNLQQPPTSTVFAACDAFDMPYSANEVVGGPGFHQDENMVQQMGAEALGEVDLYGGNCSDSILGKNWLLSFAEKLLNDEEPIAMDVGNWKAGYSDFEFQAFFN